MLADQREENCDEIPSERKSGDYALMKWFVRLSQRRDGNFKPCALVTLSRMIEAGQVGSFGRHARAWFGNHIHHAHAFDTTQVLAGHAGQRALYIRYSVPRQFPLVLILYFDRH